MSQAQGLHVEEDALVGERGQGVVEGLDIGCGKPLLEAKNPVFNFVFEHRIDVAAFHELMRVWYAVSISQSGASSPFASLIFSSVSFLSSS